MMLARYQREWLGLGSMCEGQGRGPVPGEREYYSIFKGLVVCSLFSAYFSFLKEKMVQSLQSIHEGLVAWVEAYMERLHGVVQSYIE